MSCTCRSPKNRRQCESCGVDICKNCMEFLDEKTFAFLEKLPDELKHSFYCISCHDTIVAPALAEYEDNIAKAREVIFISKAYKGHLPVIRKSTSDVSVKEAVDRDEVVLRLAFQAVLQGFNSIIQAELSSEKVRNHSYQKSRWAGKGTPAELDLARLRLEDEKKRWTEES